MTVPTAGNGAGNAGSMEREMVRAMPRNDATPYILDTAALWRALDRERDRQRLSWREVERAAGLPQGVTTRLKGGMTLHANGLASLLAWLGQPMPFARRVAAEDAGPAMRRGDV